MNKFLYEMVVVRIYEDGRTTETDYQMPAESKEMAYLKVGRTFHREDYEVKIRDFKQVR